MRYKNKIRPKIILMKYLSDKNYWLYIRYSTYRSKDRLAYTERRSPQWLLTCGTACVCCNIPLCYVPFSITDPALHPKNIDLGIPNPKSNLLRIEMKNK